MQKKRSGILLRFLSVILVLALMTVSLPACDSRGAEFQFNLAHFFPGTHPAEKVFIQGWIEAVEKATDGRVSITSYPGETLVSASGMYDGVTEGVADIGMSCFSYTDGRFPVLAGFELPGVVYNNSKSASMVAWEGIKELDPEEIQDTKLMMVIATGPGDLFTKTPVRRLEDVQGMQIRATGISSTVIELLGGTPVGMSQADAYESLQKGVVDGNLSPVEVLQGWKHAEVTDYLTLTPFLYNTLFYVTFNLEKWNSLPADLQTKITEATEEFHQETGIAMWDSQNTTALEYAVDDMGMEVIPLSEEEQAKWIAAVKPLQDQYSNAVSDLTDRDVMAYIKDLADKYNEIYP
jgi:TRAP-type transport system periplasmic protein